jgi:serine/threonine protein phosphatase PrpC
MLTFHGETDVGRRRPLNEDTIYAQDGLFLVCDGMGGHKAGEVASALAVEAISGFIRRSSEDPEMTWPYGYDTTMPYDANRLGTAIKLANRLVFRKAASDDEYTGMGTTVASVMVAERRGHMTYAHVGDSRIYLCRAGMLRQLTRDDTWANVALADGIDSDTTAPMKNVLTKALGARDEVEFGVEELALQEGDLILLCSDGLTNMVSDEEILQIARASEHDLGAACRELVSVANAAGGRDNISAAIARYAP